MSCSDPVNLCFTAGDDEPIQVLWTDEAETPVQTVSAKMQLRRTLYAAVSLELNAVIGAGPTYPIDFTATQGETQGLLDANEGEAVYLYDIEAIDTNSKKKTIAYGEVTVTESRTR